jgi:glycosyltransferase involved in cell wall biosynthesis
MKNKELITLIIPAFNEEKSLSEIIPRLEKLAKKVEKYNLEFLFVNDGSRDKTAEILAQEAEKNPAISVLNFSRNFGKEIAVAAGIDHARGDAAVIMDADGEEPPELIPEMISWWEQGFDDVYARRSSRNEGFIKKFTSKIYYRLLQKMSRVEIQLDTGDFRLFSRKALDALREIRENSRQNKAIFSWIGFKKKEILFDRVVSNDRESRWKIGFFSSGNSLINLAIDGFTSNTTLPLRFITFAGILVSAASFFAIVFVIVQAFAGVQRAAGYPTLLIVVLFLGGVQMIALGIIGEYIGRIFIETKRRPLYLIQDFTRGKIAKKSDEKFAKNEKKND